MGTYLVERFMAGEATEQLARIAEAAGQACRRLGDDGVKVRYLGSTLVPEDESCFCLFEASSRADVERANRAGGLGYVRISEAVASEGWAGTGTKGGGSTWVTGGWRGRKGSGEPSVQR